MPDDNETGNIEHVSAFSGIMRSPQRPFFDSQQSWDLATVSAYAIARAKTQNTKVRYNQQTGN